MEFRGNGWQFQRRESAAKVIVGNENCKMGYRGFLRLF
jgi:hypothetical protein